MRCVRAKRTTRFAANALSALLAVLAMLGRASVVFADEGVRVASPAPAFRLQDLQGKEVKLSDFNGKALLVCFFASWNKPCKKQIAVLIEMQKQYGEKDLCVIGMSLDQVSPKVVKVIREELQINYPVLIADYDVVQQFGGLNAIPTTFVIDKNHNIIQKHVGIVERDVLEADVKAILKP